MDKKEKEIALEEFATNVMDVSKAVKRVAKAIYRTLDSMEDLGGYDEIERFDSDVYETLKSLEKVANLIDEECLY